ncbi:MAG TPA: DUF2723 domain-containing protein [Candidatus Udaeobacter sp.]|nr:DUF2723 domain-containing protein [Candidatus Udaeobacter sp.]
MRALPWLVPALFALALYLGTWCPFPTWAHYGEDGPELEAAGRTLGIPHPTGYPLLMLLVRVTGLLLPPPWSALNLLTLAAAVLAVAAAGICGRALAERMWPGGRGAPLAGIAAGLGLATALSFWKQSVIGEVYTLHVAILLIALALLIPKTAGARRALLACYVLGLGLAHHLQILPAIAVIVLWLAIDGRLAPAIWQHPRRTLAGLLLFVAPASLYLVHRLRSAHHPIMDWGDPETWPRLWWSMSGAPYRGHLLGGGPLATFERWLDAFLSGPFEQLGILGTALAALGLGLALVRSPRTGALLCLLMAAASGIAAAYDIPDPAAYYLPAVAALALAAGLGATWLVQTAGALASRIQHPLRIVPAAAACGLLAAALGLQISQVRPEADARAELAGLDYAALGTAALAPHALVLTHGDGRTFSLWYGTLVLAPRPDVLVLYDHLLDWPWYQEQVHRRDPSVRMPSPAQGREMMRAVLIADQLPRRPVYLTELEPEIAHLFTIERAGPLFRVTSGPDLTAEMDSVRAERRPRLSAGD